MFKVNNKGTRKTPLASFAVFIGNFGYVSHLVQVFLIFNLEQLI